ncbi:MAG: hypothetical protein ABJH63_01105 [Rhizobiaceae bacterium]
MLKILALLLPGLIPSWKFFKSIEPSPRVQWRLISATNRNEDTWREFRPRPQQVSALETLRRLFWNPDWNESLYLVSLAERLTQKPTDHSHVEISQRIARRVSTDSIGFSHIQFRLVFVRREKGELVEDITFLSEPYRLDGAAS